MITNNHPMYLNYARVMYDACSIYDYDDLNPSTPRIADEYSNYVCLLSGLTGNVIYIRFTDFLDASKEANKLFDDYTPGLDEWFDNLDNTDGHVIIEEDDTVLTTFKNETTNKRYTFMRTNVTRGMCTLWNWIVTEYEAGGNLQLEVRNSKSYDAYNALKVVMTNATKGVSELLLPYGENIDKVMPANGISISTIWSMLGIHPSDSVCNHCNDDKVAEKLKDVQDTCGIVPWGVHMAYNLESCYDNINLEYDGNKAILSVNE